MFWSLGSKTLQVFKNRKESHNKEYSNKRCKYYNLQLDIKTSSKYQNRKNFRKSFRFYNNYSRGDFDI